MTSLKLCDFLLLFLSPNSIFRGGGELCTAASKSCSRESLLRKGRNQRVGETLSGISVRLISINHSHLSSAAPRTSSGRLISTAVVLINDVDGRSVCDAPLLAPRHVNKLMTFILKNSSHIPLRHLMVCSHRRGRVISRPDNEL